MKSIEREQHELLQKLLAELDQLQQEKILAGYPLDITVDGHPYRPVFPQ